MKEICKKDFANGTVYLLETDDGYPVEVTDTFLPFYTKDAIGRNQNHLTSEDLGSRKERWLIGVSTMSGCPVRCKFCATGKMRKFRNLTEQEIVDQFYFILSKHPDISFSAAKEHKINYTRMGECGLNLDNVKNAIERITKVHPETHHFVSTIGIKGMDTSWVKGNISLQVSVHSLREDTRNDLIPFKNKMTLKELGQIRTDSNLKTTVNMTLVDEDDFDIEVLKELFDPKHFFVKLSPINKNEISEVNGMGVGIIEGVNLV
jgi:adenine C2-methylase RlmN of 23S rRNA A2503 and tRNA A37